MNAPLTRTPGRHLAGRDPSIVRLERDARLAVAGVESWHVILRSGVDLITECVSFAEFLVREGRVVCAVGTDPLGRRVEVTP